MRCLLVMTDGVADDYFPPETGVAVLEGDLALNGILPPRDAQPAPLEISIADFEYESAVLLEGGAVPVRIRSAAPLADTTGLAWTDRRPLSSSGRFTALPGREVGLVAGRISGAGLFRRSNAGCALPRM